MTTDVTELKHNALESNVWKFYLSRTLTGFRLIAPIRVLFLLTFISYAQIGVMELAASIVILALEIPSGVFADLVGRKTSMLIGSILSTLAFVCVGLGSGLGLFALGWAISGASDAFHSGADEAMLYDSLKKLDREEDYIKITSRLNLVRALTGVVGSVAGAYLYQMNIRLPWLIFAVFIGLSGLVTWSMVEPHTPEKGYSVSNQVEHLKGAFVFSFTHPTVRWLILFFLVLSIPMFAFVTLMSQPYLMSRGFKVTSLGFIFGLIHGVSGVLSALSHRVESRIGEKLSVLLITVLYVAVFVLAGLVEGRSVVFGLVILLYLVENYKGVVFGTYLNHHVRSENRATVLSIRSFLSNVLVTLLVVLIGYFIDLYTIDAVLVGLGAAVGLASLPFLLRRYTTRFRRVSRAEAAPEG
ncbi:MAG: MFS transporter [Anaerolineae bacterium]